MAEDATPLQCEFCKGDMGKISGCTGDNWWCGWCGTLRLEHPEGGKMKWFRPKVMEENVFQALCRSYSERAAS